MQYHTIWGSVPSSSRRHFLFPTFHSTWSPPCTCTACSPCRTPCWSPSPGSHHGCNELRINSKELESTWCSCGRRPQDPRQWFLPWMLLPWPRTHPLSQLCLRRKDFNRLIHHRYYPQDRHTVPRCTGLLLYIRLHNPAGGSDHLVAVAAP